MAEPLTLSEAKAHLRKTDTSEDALITSFIVEARVWVENWTGHILVSRTITETFSLFGNYLTLRYRPVTALGDIDYFDEDGDAQVYEAGVLRAEVYPARVYPPNSAMFPTIGTDTGITVEYTAGYGAGAIPNDMIAAMKVLIAGMYMERGGPGEDAMKAAKALLREYHKPALA